MEGGDDVQEDILAGICSRNMDLPKKFTTSSYISSHISSHISEHDRDFGRTVGQESPRYSSFVPPDIHAVDVYTCHRYCLVVGRMP
jgi:hypothetical protein